MKHLFFRMLCVLALLLAQQSALVHAVSHVAHASGNLGTPLAVQPHGKKEVPVHAVLCALDPVFSSVLGIAPAARAGTVPDGDRFVQPAHRQSVRSGIQRFSSFPRGPPARL